MDKILVENINDKVSAEDTLYFLEDWCFTQGKMPLAKLARIYREQINCKKVVLIWGNHDTKGRNNTEFTSLFQGCYDLLETKFAVLCHYAMLTWNGQKWGKPQLYGHSHGSLQDRPTAKQMDVGVDTIHPNNTSYLPYSEEEIAEIMSKKQFVPVDHHGQRE